MPLGTQRWIHTDEPRRQEHAAHGDVLQIAVQCHLEGPEATVELEQHFKKKKAQANNAESCAGVSHISAGVHPRYQMLRGKISASDTRARQDPLQVKGRRRVTAIADSVLPIKLIPF